ncbi:MAG: class I SAM-dependent methyltransferase [Planctomycetes bacterium]|nr:class I SAM-dependent methyltransferase [Planctomycetota bacterium]
MEKSFDPRSFDHIAESFDSVASLQERPRFFLDHLPNRRRRALDIGCGSGILAEELSRHFDSVLAIDISEAMLRLARKKRSAPNIHYRCADANALSIDGEFDLIASHTTFHHLENVQHTLRALISLLAPGGRLVVVDVSREWKPPSSVSVLGSFIMAVPNAFRLGPSAAWRILRFETSKEWLEHVAADRFLTNSEFRSVYGKVLPGATFSQWDYYVGVVWHAPPAREPAA